MESLSMLVTHTDIDGIGSAAAYIRLGLRGGRYAVRFTEPEDLPVTLEEIWDLYGDRVGRLVITDLAPNIGNYERIGVILRAFRDRGARVEWYDHHEWDQGVLKHLTDFASIRVDRSTCATGVVASSFETRDGFIEELVSAVCSIDLWRFHDPLSPWLLRLSIYRKDDLWRSIMLKTLVRADSLGGVIEWGRQYIEKIFDKEIRLYNYYRDRAWITAVDGIRLASLVKRHREISTSQLAHYILSISGSDIALIINPRGPLSLRSRRCDVRIIAVGLGGGGHRPAAGAYMRIPLLYRILYRVGLEGALHRYVVSRVSRVIRATGCVRIDNSTNG